MSLREETGTERLLAERDRYVSRGVATPAIAVARAEGARIEDVDGRAYIDFGGGIGVVVFARAFHGRTLLTMTMTSKLVYKRGFGPFAPDVYRSLGPYPYRGVGTDEAIDALELLFHQDVAPATVACVVLEPVQG